MVDNRGLTTSGVLVGVLVLLLVGVGAMAFVGRVEQAALRPITIVASGDAGTALQEALRRLARGAIVDRRGDDLVILLDPTRVGAVRALAGSAGPYELSVELQAPGGGAVGTRLVVADQDLNYQRSLQLPLSASALTATLGAQPRAALVFTLETSDGTFGARRDVSLPLE